jgi:hypothetical protein
MDAESQANSLETTADLGESPEAVARRWKLELKLADKRESAWRKRASDIYKLYTPETPAANSFNILWTNTETLRQATYNSLPQPDARRRYQDDDQLGKAVGEVLARSLEFSQDTYDFDAVLKGDVLSMLLPGRAVSRVKYIPDIRSIGGEDSASDDDTQESESYEEIEWEQVICERVQWDDLRISAGKTWEQVCWVAFRHRLTRDDCIEKFGEEIGNKIPLDAVDDEDVKKSKDVGELFKTAEVWEIWDKDKKEVVWICKTYEVPCKTQDDPLELQGFFPIPRPLYAIENDASLIPAALYTQYEQQAKELNRLSVRINKIIDMCKVRGIYDSTLSELSELMKATDGDLKPAQNVTALLERGGLDKAIWMMPIDTVAAVLKELYMSRDATKQVIYEITGISDIMRSASDPQETFGAQKIKTQWGTQRLQRMQKEVQRYIRDLIRLKAEIIAEKFQPETLEAMTLIKLPHQAEVDAQFAQVQQQWQQAAMQAQQQGQQPPPPPQPPQVVTWEAVVQAMHDDATRTYRVDIETDSTLSASQDADMEGLQKLLSGLAAMFTGFGPAVQSGALPIEAVKEMMLAVVRRAKMGSAVEDAIDKMKEPNPPADPNAGKAQIEQAKIASQKELETFKAQLQDQQHQRQLAADAAAEERSAALEAQLLSHQQEVQAQQNAHQNALEAERAERQAQMDAALEQQRIESDERLAGMKTMFDQWKAELEAAVKIEVAELSAKVARETAATKAAEAEVVREVK